jgi:hypothetical protein
MQQWLDNETAEPLPNALGREPGKDLMRAIKHSSNDRIPEPSRHETRF